MRRGKPDPEGYILAARRLGVEPSRCLVIEDAPQGAASGRAAGMRCVGLASSRPPDRSGLAEADLVVESLEDPALWALLAEGDLAEE